MQGSNFSDDQICDAVGVSGADLRRLITWKALRPAEGGRGRGRTRGWTLPHLRWIAMVAAFKDAGLTLRMAHTATFALALDLDPTLSRYDLGAQGLSEETLAKIQPVLNPKVHIINNKYVFFWNPLTIAYNQDEGCPNEYSEPTLIAKFSDNMDLLLVGHDMVNIAKADAAWTSLPSGRYCPKPESLSWRFAPELFASLKEAKDAFSRPRLATLIDIGISLRIAIQRATGQSSPCQER